MNAPVADRLAELLAPGPTRILGIVNVTPDSFSDGGAWLEPDRAIAHGLELVRQGAALVDVGGESTRPGAIRVSAAEELDRVIPVVTGLAAAGVAVSVDTMRASVARAAVEAGALVVNDVSGGRADPDMAVAVAAGPAAYIVGHWRGWPHGDDDQAVYQDVVAEVIDELAARVDAAVLAGVPRSRLIVDPGLGFAKLADHNWTLLQSAGRFEGLGLPVLWGASRKRFLGEVYATPTAPADRDVATALVTSYLARLGAWGVRTHTVAEHLVALAVTRRLDLRPAPAAAPGRPAIPAITAPLGVPGRQPDTRVPEVGPEPQLDTLDRIDLQGVEAWGRHGVFESEKTTRQLFRVDVALWLTRPDLDRARPDDVAHTVDYGLVADLVADLVTTSSFDLIETLADRLAMAILDLGGESAGAARTASSPAAVEVTVHKPQAPVTPPFADVAVTVRRRPRPRVRQVVFSLGSNLGDRAAWLRFGVAALATTPGIGQVEVSSVYESTAVGVEQQPDYLNLVVVAMSDLTAPALLERGLAIEWAAGRRRGGSPVAHGPRTLDIDLIAVGGELSATDYLTLPHPRAARRAFVLRPWLEVDPLAEVAGRPVADWLEDVTDQSIRHRPDFSILAADHG